MQKGYNADVTQPAAKREKVLACLALLLTFVVLAAGAPAPAEAVATASLASPLELVGAIDQHRVTAAVEPATHLAADPRGPPIASILDLCYPETRNRVAGQPWPPPTGLDGELSRDLRQGCEQRSGWVVVESLDAPGRGTPNRGLIYVLEGGDQRVHPRVSAAEVFEDSLPGVYSDVASGRRVVPALGFDPPASLRGGTRNSYIRFDALDPSDAQLLIDRKLSLVRFPTKSGPMIPQAARIRETLLALDQNIGFRVVYEFPDAAAARSARSILRELGVADPRLTVRVAQ